MNLIYDDVTVYIILFFVALVASAIDAIAGGGGLLVVPTMLLLGLNPLVTLGTNKLQSCFGTATSSYNYFKNGLLKEENIKYLITLSFIGSLVGTLLVSQLSNDLLTKLIPILLIAYFQWGTSSEFWYIIIIHILIQVIDGNVVVPVLFSDAVNLHPLAILISILFFGTIWGIWGVFFAIPLAVLMNTLLNIWPRTEHKV